MNKKDWTPVPYEPGTPVHDKRDGSSLWIMRPTFVRAQSYPEIDSPVSDGYVCANRRGGYIEVPSVLLAPGHAWWAWLNW